MKHEYKSNIIWTGNRGEGTTDYRAYDRTWSITIPGKAVIQCSNDPVLGGDTSKMNPEDLLISSLASCHMLWYLHLAAVSGINVLAYQDAPLGIGEMLVNGAGRFLSITLRPRISLVEGSDIELATQLHTKVSEFCFIARSVNFPVDYQPQFTLVSL